MKRNPSISLRKPEATSAVRHTAMTRERVGAYFDVLEKTIRENALPPDTIWNMDECGLQLAHRPSKVISRYSKYDALAYG